MCIWPLHQIKTYTKYFSRTAGKRKGGGSAGGNIFTKWTVHEGRQLLENYNFYKCFCRERGRKVEEKMYQSAYGGKTRVCSPYPWTPLNGRLHTKTRQVTQFVRFTHQRDKGIYLVFTLFACIIA